MDAWACWIDLQTQWRTGMGGATGLDYGAVCAYLAQTGHSGEPKKEIFEGIRAAENATLQVWAEKAKQDQK